MCSARVAFTGALLLALVQATPVGAQQPVVDRARLRARIDSLHVAYMEAESAWAAARRGRGAARPAVPLDTQRVGPLLVVSKPGAREAARAATEGALAGFGPLAHAAAPHLESAVLLIEIGGLTAPFDSMRLRPNHSRVWVPAYRPDAWQAEVVSRDIGARLGAMLPEQVRAWLNGEGLSLNRTEGLRAAYRLLVVNPSPAARACYGGAIDRCADALGLTDPGADYERWYTEPQLVTWLLADDVYRRTERDAHDACAAARTLAACRPYLEMQGSPPPPLDTNARRTLLAHALEIGGPAAWSRLASAGDAPIGDRLAAAAGVPRDSLLRSWHRSVVDARPPHAAGFGATWLVTLIWIAGIGTLAMRSTRWRLG